MSILLHHAAITAARRGWAVFPVVADTKRSAVKDWEGRATTDLARIETCWTAAGYNVGIATGPSGLVVVDLDIPKSNEPTAPEPWNQLGITSGADVLGAIAEKARQPWPHTYTVTTPSGGLHLYFTMPANTQLRNSQARLGWKIDTRAGGGYVLAAGSLVDGKPYVVIDDRDPIELPYWIASQLTTRPAPATPEAIPTGKRRSGYLTAAINGEVERIRTAAPNHHNESIYRASIALGQLVAGRAIAYADAHTALRAAAEVHVQGTCQCTASEVEATIKSGLDAGEKRPRGRAA